MVTGYRVNPDIGLVTYETNRYFIYRDEIYSLQNLLNRTKAGPGRAVKKEQE